jgi:hypothetical protein
MKSISGVIGAFALGALLVVSATAPADAKAPKVEKLCPDYGDWVYTDGEWALAGDNDLGSRKFDVDGNLAELYVSAPSGYLVAGFCYKAGTQQTFGFIVPPSATTVLESVKDISHFSLIFVPEPDFDEGEWCSPGFWRANANKKGASQWPVLTDTLYNAVILSPSVEGNPTLLDVLNSPQTYGGEAFNAVGTYLSTEKGLKVTDPIVHNCPLSQNP